MFQKSQEREILEKIIYTAHGKAQKETISWCLHNPFRGIPAIISTMLAGTAPKSVVRAWQSLPAWTQYQKSYKELEQLEIKEGFPAMQQYAAELDHLKDFLQKQNRTKGYYPFAGTDFYWARIFDQTVFEDIGYWKTYDQHMWWKPSAYQQPNIEESLHLLAQAGVIENKDNIQLIVGDANRTRNENDFNNKDYTMIVKGGHSVLPFISKRFKKEQLKFGAIIVVSPSDTHTELINGMAERDFSCIYHEKGERFYAPFSMGMQQRYIFSNKKK